MGTLRIRTVWIRALGICLVVGFALAGGDARGAVLDCQHDFGGIDYCIADGGQTHIVIVDLAEEGVRFDLATASDATGPNPPSWHADLRETVAQMAAAHPTLDGIPLAVAVNGDYLARDGSHGWEGFTVQRGQRLDGPTVDGADCDCTAFERSGLTLSRSKPTQAEITRRTPGELDEQQAYASRCAGNVAFKKCQSAVLDRQPAAGEAERYQSELQDRWYTAVGGGPLIIQGGQPISISQACESEGFLSDWCQDEPHVTSDRMRQLRMGTVAGISRDGKQLIWIVTTVRLPNELAQLLAEQEAFTGIRFDGSESSQIVYNGTEKTGNTRPVADALLIYANRVPADDAHLAEPVWPVIALPGDAVETTITMRNDGTVVWSGSAGYKLANVRDPMGAPEQVPLSGEVRPGETATWTLHLIAPATPGSHRSQWQLERDGQPVGERVTLWVGVLPEKAREWRAELAGLIEEAKGRWQEAKRRGEQEGEQLVEGLIAELERRLAELLVDEGRKWCTGLVPASVFALAGAWLHRRDCGTRRQRRRSKRER